MGDIYRAVEGGYRVIGLVDGVFGNVPTVWHKEILYAIDRGAAVLGAASMGAIRASELYPYGMIGVGAVYRLFRRGAIDDDDEVCLSHAPGELGFLPLSEAMVNVRFTLRRLRRLHRISLQEEREISAHLKAIFFAFRTASNMGAAIETCLPEHRRKSVVSDFMQYRVDVKRADAIRLLAIMEGGKLCTTPFKSWAFESTHHWRANFHNGEVAHKTAESPRD